MPNESNESQSASALSALGTGPAAKELYVDLLRPAATILGKDLETVARAIHAALSPLRGLVWSFEKVEHWLASALLRRLASTNPERIHAPQAYIAGQVLLQLPFCAEQERLREMYASLLASDMTTQETNEVHPAFVCVIQQLTPDEAVLLNAISKRGGLSLSETMDEMGEFLNPGRSISEQFHELCESAQLKNPSLSDAYLDNLLRLRVLSEHEWSEGQYRSPSVHDYGDSAPFVENQSGRFVELTTFGGNFIKTCASNIGSASEPGV